MPVEPRRESARAGDEVAMAMPEPRAAADGAVGPEPRAATDGAVGPEPRAATDGSVGPLELIGGRFAKQRVLKVAAGVTTLAAVDITTGRPVVVKVAASSDVPTGARLRLSHEASVLADVAGPGLVPVLAADEQGGLVYLVMPLLPGESLAVRLARGPLGATGALTIARALLVALATAHEHGVLHRDVKPGNVIIDGDPVAQVNLVDFGLARSQTLDAPLRDYPVGTARYVSPEQAGLLHREVDERSDLYSLGVLIFECLAGRPPFDEDSVGGLLRAHLTTPPPDLRSLGVALPTALNEIVQRLLRKDPNDRYQSARAALADVEELVQRLADGDPDPLVVVGGRDRRPTLTEPAFVGRTAELAALDAAAAAADVGDGGVLLVEAESGGGKSRLLEEFAQRCAGRSAWVLRGQGLDQAAPLPFQVLQGVAAGVLDAARVEPGVAERLRARLGTEAPAVRDALPALGELLPGAPSELLGPEEHGEARNLNALAVLLDALGDVQRPAVVLLDDCQWADDLTVKLLRSWGRRRGEAGQHVLVVAAFRSEEVAGDDPLRQAGSTTVRLTPFGPEDVHALVSSMAGTVPTDVLALIGRLCAGSPFMASAVLRGLVEFGALVHDGSGWAGDPDLLASAQSSTEAAVFLSRRLQLLPAVTSRLLTAGAVLGKEFDLATAGALTAMTPAEALDAVAATRGRHILWFDPLTARCSFVHDKLRETVLADVTAERRRELHLAAARHLESHGPRTAFALAYHYHAAGEAAAALPFALTAAVEARARHALGVAEQQYRIADEGGAGADPATRRAIVLGLGDVLMLRGRYAESIRWLERALELSDDELDRAEALLRLGELSFKRGDVPESISYGEGALRALRRRVPRRSAGFAAGALWEVLVQVVHCILPRRFVARRTVDGAEREMLAARIYSRLAYSYWFGRGKLPTGWAHLREMNLLERYPPTLLLAQAYSEHAPVATTIPYYSRGIAYVARSLEIRRQFGDVWGQGQSLHFYGVVLYAASRFEEAISKLTEAIRLLERTGDQWEINTARWHVGFALYRLGRLDEAVETCRRCYREGMAIGDHHAAAISLSGWSKASGGRVPAELIAAEAAHAGEDAHTTAELNLAEGIRLLAEGDARAAAIVFADGDRQAKAAGLHTEYVAPMQPWLATALRQQAEATSSYAPAQRRVLLRQAARAARRGARLARSYRNNRPHALREAGLVAALRGRPHQARRLLAASLEGARELGMLAEVQETTAMLANVTATGTAAPDRAPGTPGWPAASNAPGRGVLRPPDLSLLDRFDRVLHVGRAIAASLTSEAVYAEVRAAAFELLRGEESTVFLVPAEGFDGQRLIPLEETSSIGVGERLAARALASGRPELFTPEIDGEPADGLGLGTRSALAAPVFVRGRPVACLHVAHRQVRGLFGEDELRLAEFVATLAGAALENAEGFAAAQALSSSLEVRVAQRTEELTATNEVLRAALEELERVNEELRAVDQVKSDFVAMVSHELKTPLTSILGYCALMLRRWHSVDDEQKVSYIGVIESESQRLARMVHDLLNMSRIESGRLVTRLAAVGLADAVAVTLASYNAVPDDVATAIDPTLRVLADPDQLTQILINLIDNARRYGAAPISIRARRSGSDVVFSVSDLGPGVPAAFVPQLFEKFTQASTGPTRRTGGTGLGLSIVRGLVRAQGGDIWYEPNEPVGARFCVRLSTA